MNTIERATVSVCLIAKNEAGTLQPCLKSVRDVVDEIVVLVDDSTTDDTFEKAKKYADVVDYFKWEDNFSAARNQSIAKCTKEWILIMDAHEILHPKSKSVLTNLLQRVQPGKDMSDTSVFSGMIYMNPEGQDLDKLIPEIFFLQPRLFKNNGDHLYEGRVHNWLATKEGSRGLKRPVNEMVFIHRRTEENRKVRKEQRKSMNVEILLKDIEENPTVARYYFYLANTYLEVDEHDKAIETYNKYLEMSTWNAERAHAMLMMATIYCQRKAWKEAMDILYDALHEDWERAEIYCLLGDVAYEQKDFYRAQHWWNAAKDKRPPMNGLFLTGPAYTYMPYEKLANLYTNVGEWIEASFCADKAIELGSQSPNMKKVLSLCGDKLKLKPDQPNIILYDENDQFTFLHGIHTELNKEFNVATAAEYDSKQSKWADVVWFEWCNKNIIKATNMVKPKGQRWIVRLHGFEIYSTKRMMNIDWSKIDVLMFVAEHTRQHFMDTFWMADNTKNVVIPNGVDLNKWSFAKREFSEKKNIAVIGILTEKKGPQLLAKTIRYFSKMHPDYRFLLRMDVLSDPDVNKKMLDYELRDLTNWEWVPRVESVNAWLEDVKFLLSTSILESFGFVIAEAMAKGIKPLIHDFRGSRDMYPENLIWRDMEELEQVFCSEYKSEEYREWIEEHFSLDGQMTQIKKLLVEMK